MYADLADSYIFADDIERPLAQNYPFGCWDFCISYENHSRRIANLLEPSVSLLYFPS